MPITTQWNYATGFNWTRFGENSFQNFVFSRNHLNNRSYKYYDMMKLIMKAYYKTIFHKKLKINLDLKIPLEKMVGNETMEQE